MIHYEIHQFNTIINIKVLQNFIYHLYLFKNYLFALQWKSRWCVMRKLSPVAGKIVFLNKLHLYKKLIKVGYTNMYNKNYFIIS